MSERIQILQPEGWAQPRGYANGVLERGRRVHVGGMIGWQADQTFATDDFVAQFAQALDNVIAVVESAGGQATDVVQMTVYVTDLDAYRTRARELGPLWRERFGKHYPAMALVGVAGLVHPQALVEIEATASLPEE